MIFEVPRPRLGAQIAPKSGLGAPGNTLGAHSGLLEASRGLMEASWSALGGSWSALGALKGGRVIHRQLKERSRNGQAGPGPLHKAPPGWIARWGVENHYRSKSLFFA